MAILNFTDLHTQAQTRLEPQTGQARKLVVLYTGLIALLALGINALHLVLDSQISGTGGLGGLGTRSMLQTIQEILTYVNLLYGPFWSAGFLFAMLNVVRGAQIAPGNLLEGFRRLGRILGGLGYLFVRLLLLGFLVTNLTVLIFAFTPLSNDFAQAMGPALTDPNLFLADGTLNLELIPPGALNDASPVILVIFLALFLPCFLHMRYSYRMASYLMMSEERMGGAQAHVISKHLMRGHKWQMVKLDLHFWWYYLLGALISAVAYLDYILKSFGVALPLGDTFWFFATMVVYCGLLLLLNLWKKPQVDATYVAAYEAIAHPAEVAKTE